MATLERRLARLESDGGPLGAVDIAVIEEEPRAVGLPPGLRAHVLGSTFQSAEGEREAAFVDRVRAALREQRQLGVRRPLVFLNAAELLH